jgi:UrcA family protein
MFNFGKSIVIAMVTTGLLGGAPALAGESNLTVDRVSVFYGDLDLSRQAGADVLYYRIAAAATQACGGRPDSREIAGTDRFRACRRAAMDSAVTRLGNPKVAALAGRSAGERVATK